MTKIVLTIAGFDPSGGAGTVTDVKAISAFGCFATAAVTSLTFQNTTGVFGADNQTAKTVRAQIVPILDDFTIDAVKTGMLPTAEIIGVVGEILEQYLLKNIVVDPVVRSTSGFDLIDDAALRVLVEKLFPKADLITPNIPEAERITGISIKDETNIEAAARKMQAMGAANVLIKGGHLPASHNKMAKDFLFVGESLHTFEQDFIETTATHGTGCTLSAAIAANLALGMNLVDAVGISKEFVFNAIRTAPHIGRGHSPINIKSI